jgi:hypothetical protein
MFSNDRNRDVSAEPANAWWKHLEAQVAKLEALIQDRAEKSHDQTDRQLERIRNELSEQIKRLEANVMGVERGLSDRLHSTATENTEKTGNLEKSIESVAAIVMSVERGLSDRLHSSTSENTEKTGKLEKSLADNSARSRAHFKWLVTLGSFAVTLLVGASGGVLTNLKTLHGIESDVRSHGEQLKTAGTKLDTANSDLTKLSSDVRLVEQRLKGIEDQKIGDKLEALKLEMVQAQLAIIHFAPGLTDVRKNIAAIGINYNRQKDAFDEFVNADNVRADAQLKINQSIRSDVTGLKAKIGEIHRETNARIYRVVLFQASDPPPSAINDNLAETIVNGADHTGYRFRVRRSEVENSVQGWDLAEGKRGNGTFGAKRIKGASGAIDGFIDHISAHEQVTYLYKGNNEFDIFVRTHGPFEGNGKPDFRYGDLIKTREEFRIFVLLDLGGATS